MRRALQVKPGVSRAMSDAIRRSSEWYEAQCNGEWEHHKGVLIETLDNPGWSVKVDLDGTPLAQSAFTELTELADERNWIHCVVKGQRFEGNGGPDMLGRILDVFLDWAAQGREPRR